MKKSFLLLLISLVLISSQAFAVSMFTKNLIRLLPTSQEDQDKTEIQSIRSIEPSPGVMIKQVKVSDLQDIFRASFQDIANEYYLNTTFENVDWVKQYYQSKFKFDFIHMKYFNIDGIYLDFIPGTDILNLTLTKVDHDMDCVGSIKFGPLPALKLDAIHQKGIKLQANISSEFNQTADRWQLKIDIKYFVRDLQIIFRGNYLNRVYVQDGPYIEYLVNDVFAEWLPNWMKMNADFLYYKMSDVGPSGHYLLNIKYEGFQRSLINITEPILFDRANDLVEMHLDSSFYKQIKSEFDSENNNLPLEIENNTQAEQFKVNEQFFNTLYRTVSKQDMPIMFMDKRLSNSVKRHLPLIYKLYGESVNVTFGFIMQKQEYNSPVKLHSKQGFILSGHHQGNLTAKFQIYCSPRGFAVRYYHLCAEIYSDVYGTFSAHFEDSNLHMNIIKGRVFYTKLLTDRIGLENYFRQKDDIDLETHINLVLKERILEFNLKYKNGLDLTENYHLMKNVNSEMISSLILKNKCLSNCQSDPEIVIMAPWN